MVMSRMKASGRGKEAAEQGLVYATSFNGTVIQ